MGLYTERTPFGTRVESNAWLLSSNGHNGHRGDNGLRETPLSTMERIHNLIALRRSPFYAGTPEIRSWGVDNPSRLYLDSAYILIQQIASTSLPAAWVGRCVGEVNATDRQAALLEVNVLADDPDAITNLLRGYIHHFRTEGKWPVPAGAMTIQARSYYETAATRDPLSDSAIQLVAWTKVRQPLRGERLLSILTGQILEAVAKGDETLQKKFLRRLEDYLAMESGQRDHSDAAILRI